MMKEARASSPAPQLTEQVSNTRMETKEVLSLGHVHRTRLVSTRETPKEKQ